MGGAQANSPQKGGSYTTNLHGPFSFPWNFTQQNLALPGRLQRLPEVRLIPMADLASCRKTCSLDRHPTQHKLGADRANKHVDLAAN